MVILTNEIGTRMLNWNKYYSVYEIKALNSELMLKLYYMGCDKKRWNDAKGFWTKKYKKIGGYWILM